MRVSLLLLWTLCAAWAIPVFVMMPLDTVTNNGQLNSKYDYDGWFRQLKQGGVAGVMCDVWWGLAEPSPKQYTWNAYSQLLQKVSSAGLQFKATMSFHKCGTNVGDECFIPLPSWVTSVGNSNPDIYYTDRERNKNDEYLTLGVDNLQIFSGRSPVQIYADYVGNFVNTFKNYLGNTIVELQISLGPAGELRYPSYPLSRWSFPGVGEFQCYDRYMLKMLNDSAVAAGHPEWGRGGPSNAGYYSCNPCQDNNCGTFFTNGFDNFASAYGQFFLNWYSQALIAHGNNILSPISRIVSGLPVRLAAKVSGVHWQFHTPAHGAEQTAGYKNDQGTAYVPIAKMFKQNGVSFDFTCFEMKDSEQPGGACSGPQELVAMTMKAMRAAGGHYSGENALPRYDSTAYDTIYDSAKNDPSLFDDFTYLRLGNTLMSGSNWDTFRSFVGRMNNLH